jgi:Tol biopolymer transport system component
MDDRSLFVRLLEDGPAIYAVPWPSGQERRLVQLTGPTSVSGGYSLAFLSWSPDGEWLAFGQKPSEDEPVRIVRFALDTLEERPLTTPPRDAPGDFWPAISPDGSQLAFVRLASVGYGNQDLWVQTVDGGEPRRLTFGRYTGVVPPWPGRRMEARSSSQQEAPSSV